MSTVLFAVLWALIIILSAVLAVVVFSGWKKLKPLIIEEYNFGWLYVAEGLIWGDKAGSEVGKLRRFLLKALAANWVCDAIDFVGCRRNWGNVRIMNAYRWMFDLEYAGNKFYKSFRWYLRMYKLGYYFSGLNGLCDFVRINFERDGYRKDSIIDIDYGEHENFGEFVSEAYSQMRGGYGNKVLFRWDEDPERQDGNDRHGQDDFDY